jgi:acyl carrier protein
MASTQQVIEVVCRVGGLPELRPDEDIYAAGFSSIRALQLLLELETVCEVTIPDEEFVKARCALDLEAMLDRIKGASA